MLALLVRVAIFYFLFIFFKAVLKALMGPTQSNKSKGTNTAYKAKSKQTGDVFEADFKVVDDEEKDE